jgi:hypothetical protein
MAHRVGGVGQFLKERGFTPGENNQAVRDESPLKYDWYIYP